MRAGSLRHRVTIQARATTRDTLGGQANDWADVATVWADVSPISGRERLAAQAGRAELSHTVTIRYQRQFSDPVEMAKRRIVYGARVLNIEASRDVDERHFDIELSCSEGINEG
jgi:SPP1 family predicted phage head-tail adaptor